MLLQNFTPFNANPGHAIGGPPNPSDWLKGGSLMMFYAGDAEISGETEKSSFPNGYVPPYSFVLAPKAGGLASFGEISGLGEIASAGMALGKNCEAALSGSGSISAAALSMVIQAAAALTGTGAISSAALVGKVELASSLAGSGDLSGALGALAFCVASLTGTGTLNPPDLDEIANMSADISPFTTLSPENLAAAVWNALAADFNDAGTMGEKLNSASSAGDPWGTALPGAYADGTAGKIVGQKLLTLAKFLALK